MARVLAVGGVRFVLVGVLVAALAACFVGRADAASVLSSSFASSAVFAQPSASAASVVVGDRALTLKWSAVKGAAGYRVSWRGRVLKGGKPTAAWSAKWLGLKALKASSRSYKATGLVNGAQYQLRLESNTKAKKSRWVARSTPVGSPKAVTPTPTPAPAPTPTPTPTPATVPSAPTSVSGVARDTSVAVSWLAPSSNGGSAITGYTVTASGGGSQSCTTIGALSCSVAGLTNGTSYTFTVKATNAVGDSVASVASPAVTPATVPDAPTSVGGVARDNYVFVYWVPPSSDGSSAITGYTVTASGGGSQTCTVDSTTDYRLGCDVFGLTNGTAYTFTVKATNARGDSVASLTSDAFTPGSWNVGDDGPGGGKVFYAPNGTFTETGAACGSSCRYLEAAPAGWNSGGSPDPSLQWGGGDGTDGQCSNKNIAGAAGTAIGSGKANTAAIMADCHDSSGSNSAPAALAASTYAPSVNGAVVSGWFLPSKDELNALDISSVGGLAASNGDYWSSSQGGAGSAWSQGVGGVGGVGNQGNSDKDFTFQVRPVRAF